MTGDHDGQENRRYHVRENQNAILRDLRVRDALHAAEYGVHEDDRHPDVHTRVDVDFEEAAEDDAHTPHLARDIRERNEDRAHDGDDASDA